jgi:hypothetical protein
MCQQWGLNPSAHWPELDYVERLGVSWDEAAELAADEAEALGFLREGGWRAVAVKNNGLNNGGMTAHRGVLHPDEYVDALALQKMVEAELGFTYEQVRSVYRQGPLSADQRELRGRIDARLLALSHAGGHMLELARAFGWTVKAGGPHGGPSCDTMERALVRARSCEAVAA